MAEKMIALNIGAGNDYRESTDEIEWINVDNGVCKKDYWLNIEKTPFSFKIPLPSEDSKNRLSIIRNEYDGKAIEDTFDRIDAIQVLEHVDPKRFPHIVRELYRISKNRAEWNVSVPYGLSDNYVTDFTHKCHFSPRTFDYFVDFTQLRENGKIYGFGDINLYHISPPQIDSVYSIHFKLGVSK